MTETPRRKLFGRAPVEPPIAEEVPRGVRIAAAWSWRLLLIAAVIAIVVWLVVVLRFIVIPVMIALLLAALLVPFKNWLHRHRWPNWLAITTALLSLIIVVSGLMTLWISQVARRSGELAKQAQASWKQWAQMLADSPLHISQKQLDEWVASAVKTLQTDNTVWLHGALSVGTTVGHVLAGLLLTLFATLFFLIDGRGIWRWIVRLAPERAYAAIDGAGHAGWKTLTSFVRVQILVAAVNGVGIGLGAFLLGVPLAIPIGILVFLGSFIPVVGAIVTGVIACFLALVYNGPVIALILLAVVIVVHQLEGHVMQPLIMGSAVKVHPLAVVLVVAAGSFLGGIAGALFAVPVVATLNVMISYHYRRAWQPGAPPPKREPLWMTEPLHTKDAQ